MKKLISAMLLSMALTLVLGACSSTPRMTDAERLAFYEAHAGEPVRSFRLFGRINSWTRVNNSTLVVWTRPSEAWLLDLNTCPDLQFATSISISHFSNTVTARFDTVTPRGPGTGRTGQMPCRIMQIRPLDTTASNQTSDERYEGEAEERSDAPPAEPTAN
ncbi:DUF6491 family protein [Pseudoxanthomonas koreensis]|uniref:DUF6491 family protein n=1 Tax=Pseudoxanthomonas koreensis TaxID=266061 RepID=UPI001391FFAA|nr:DUF6491 family protein [Pseudoxanthomonas koreensis]KAF1692899.1 hypothetical protein CSC64_06415 [Pseudoxanthomonas koreensis]